MKAQEPQKLHVSTLPYIKIYRHINAAQKPRRYIVFAGITTSIILIAVLIFNFHYGWMYAIFVALAAALVWFSLTVCAFFTYRGLGYGDSEENLIFTALQFLRMEKYDDSILETIKARAEISTTVSPVRSFLPILLIPIIISLLNNLGAMPLLSWFLIAFILEILLFPLAIDTYTAHIDGVIRHAIAEYICEQKGNKRCSVKDKDQLLLQALLTNDMSHCHITEDREGWMSKRYLK